MIEMGITSYRRLSPTLSKKSEKLSNCELISRTLLVTLTQGQAKKQRIFQVRDLMLIRIF